MDGRGQFTFYRSYRDALMQLSKKDRLAAWEAITDYALDGIEPSLSGPAAMAFLLIKPTLEASRKKAEIGKLGGSKTKANSKQNGSKTEAKRKQNGSEDESEKENEIEIEKEIEIEIEREDDSPVPRTSAPRFRKPTVEQIAAYCRERGNGIDPEQFWDFYESKGWMVGRDRMKDFRAAVRTWERRTQNRKTPDSRTTAADIARMIEDGEFDD